MASASPASQQLARRLIALEAARGGPTPGPGWGSQVCERLRVPLARLAGEAGFRSLLSRALALARVKIDLAKAVRILPTGELTGFDSGDPAGETEVVTQLLGLLVTFIGEPLTRQLIHEVWPEAAAVELDGKDAAKP